MKLLVMDMSATFNNSATALDPETSTLSGRPFEVARSLTSLLYAPVNSGMTGRYVIILCGHKMKKTSRNSDDIIRATFIRHLGNNQIEYLMVEREQRIAYPLS
ncbi:hypothetical protein ACJX0J_032592 [Zea mays]